MLLMGSHGGRRVQVQIWVQGEPCQTRTVELVSGGYSKDATGAMHSGELLRGELTRVETS